MSSGSSTSKYPEREERKAEGIKLFFRNSIFRFPKMKNRSFQIKKLQAVSSKVKNKQNYTYKF